MNTYRNARAFAAGQARRDNAAPEDDGATECPECEGTGTVLLHLTSKQTEECQHCGGTGWVDADGYPVEAPE